MGAKGADTLASAVGQCTSLVHLDLSFNKIDGQAAGKVTDQLRHCQNLAVLKLRENQIGSVGAGLVADALASSTALTHLDMGANHSESESGNASLRTLFETSTCIRRLNLMKDRANGGWGPILARGQLR